MSSSGSSVSESSSSSSSGSESSENVGKKHESEEEMKIPPPLPASQPPRPFPIRKGSLVYPSGSTSAVFDSRKGHYRFLRKVGLNAAKKARKKRRKLRETLIRNGVEIDPKQYPTLQSSSSEESDAQESDSDLERETIDVQAMAHDSWWAKENLFGVMPVAEISSLVGWATHQTHDGTTNKDDDVGVARAALAVKEDARNQEAVDESTSTAPRQKPGPLLGLPNTPLPPSYLDYLTEMARGYIEEPAQTRDEWKSRSYLTTADSPSDDVPTSKKKKKKRQEWQQWDYDSQDETYQSLKAKCKKNNQVKLHVPCPAKKAKTGTTESAKANSTRSNLYESMDTSALVALGMVWEDMVTTYLLPLARQHVARCRRLEQRKQASEASASNNVSNRSEEEARMDPFHEWTLPPEQAIWRLAQEGVKSELSSTLPPTRVSNQCFDRVTPVDDMLVDRLGSTEQRKQQAVDNWCRSRDLDPSFVNNNMDLFGVVLPRAPTIPRLSAQATLQERQNRSDVLYNKRRPKSKIARKKASASNKAEQSIKGELFEAVEQTETLFEARKETKNESSSEDERIEMVAV